MTRGRIAAGRLTHIDIEKEEIILTFSCPELPPISFRPDELLELFQRLHGVHDNWVQCFHPDQKRIIQ
jgi:hypothetical protein